MRGERVRRALERLACEGAVLAPDRGHGFGVFPRGDRRRRPVVRLRREDVRALEATGALEARGDVFVLNAAGASRVRREAASEEEAFLAQHVALTTCEADGPRRVRAVVSEGVLKRLAAIKDGAGQPWLSDGELSAAARICADWEAAQGGLLRGSDWAAAPMGSAARGPGNARERALAARCDARRRVADALQSLAAPLRRVVERVCLSEEGLEALERNEGWPSRSGKLALKLGLAQLAAALS